VSQASIFEKFFFRTPTATWGGTMRNQWFRPLFPAPQTPFGRMATDEAGTKLAQRRERSR
jgi:hypothetical protein